MEGPLTTEKMQESITEGTHVVFVTLGMASGLSPDFMSCTYTLILSQYRSLKHRVIVPGKIYYVDYCKSVQLMVDETGVSTMTLRPPRLTHGPLTKKVEADLLF